MSHYFICEEMSLWTICERISMWTFCLGTIHTMWSRYRIMQNLKFSCFLFSLNIYIYFYILFARLCMANKPFRYTYIQLQNRIWKKQQINSTRLKHRKPNKIHKNVHIMLEIQSAGAMFLWSLERGLLRRCLT